MNPRIAVSLFFAICIVLALLLVLGMITPAISSAAFAAALVVLGGLSAGFRKKPEARRK